MKLSDPKTWAVPVESIEIDDPTWGVVKISRWNRFHFEQSADYPMSIILVQLEFRLVVCQEETDGYNRFNLIRASSVVNRQSTEEEF